MKGLNSMAKNDDKDVLQRYDGRGCMLKIKQCLSINKMELSFVSYGSDNKATANVNCYLDAVDFGLLCESIRTRELQTAIAKEKARALAAGELYPKVIYTSPMGGRKTDKGAVSRYFTIAPGSKADVVFTGYAFNASVSSTGAFLRGLNFCTEKASALRLPFRSIQNHIKDVTNLPFFKKGEKELW